MKPFRMIQHVARLFVGFSLVLACAGSAQADELAGALEPHVGQTLDLVELGTG